MVMNHKMREKGKKNKCGLELICFCITGVWDLLKNR